MAEGDFLSAARLWETKLNSPDEALERLFAGWANSKQAQKCLEEAFGLLGRLGRHEQTRDKIEHLRQQSFARERASVVVDVLARVATSYPNGAVRPVAADAVRTIVAGRLRGVSIDECRQLLEAVRRVASEDRLLGRDCERFVERRRKSLRSAAARTSAAIPGQRRRFPEPILIKEFSVFPEVPVEWQCAASAAGRFYLAGYREERSTAMVVVAECLWEGEQRLLTKAAWRMAAAARRPSCSPLTCTAWAKCCCTRSTSRVCRICVCRRRTLSLLPPPLGRPLGCLRGQSPPCRP